MKRICELCDEAIETGSEHRLAAAHAKREIRTCPYCREVSPPLCRTGSAAFVYVCGRCRGRWDRRD